MKVTMTILCALALSACEAKNFTKCELVEALREQWFPEEDMRDWVCLVEFESSMRTDVIGPPNSNGSRDHGLFQINDRYWCNDSDIPGKDCNVTCAELRTEDITVASVCAEKIFQRHGFTAWHGWTRHCDGQPLPDISDCYSN
ncbi:hypothetical protein ACJJTC_004766 [Scirpophaga incertulas]